MARYKINTENSVVFIYSGNEKSKQEIMKTIPRKISLKEIIEE